MTIIARKLEQARIDAGLTQEALARAVGIPLSSLRNYLAGRQVPRVDVAESICRACGTTYAEVSVNVK
jgi:transcriptional regulator with XRE-family HTH domain